MVLVRPFQHLKRLVPIEEIREEINLSLLAGRKRGIPLVPGEGGKARDGSVQKGIMNETAPGREKGIWCAAVADRVADSLGQDRPHRLPRQNGGVI
jgi:hypothetical protein